MSCKRSHNKNYYYKNLEKNVDCKTLGIAPNTLKKWQGLGFSYEEMEIKLKD